MTLTQNQITNIADDAVNLHDALIDRGATQKLAGEWVRGAMLAIVMHETEDAPETSPEPGVYPGRRSGPRRSRRRPSRRGWPGSRPGGVT